MSTSNLYLRYLQTGQGPDVVLLNGLGQHCESWRFQIEAFSQAGYRVLAFDYRGHGLSEWRDEEVNIYTYARDLDILFDQLGIKQAHLVGLSMGTAVAQAFYHLYPGKVLSLVLAGGFSFFPEPLRSEAMKNRLETLDNTGMEGVGRILAERSFTAGVPPELVGEVARMISSNHPRGYRAATIASMLADSHDFLKNIAVPVLLVVGEGDITTPPDLSHYLHENIKGSRLEILPKARHIISMEKPEVFNQKVLAFLKQVALTNSEG